MEPTKIEVNVMVNYSLDPGSDRVRADLSDIIALVDSYRLQADGDPRAWLDALANTLRTHRVQMLERANKPPVML